jgi:hypothetical protein
LALPQSDPLAGVIDGVSPAAADAAAPTAFNSGTGKTIRKGGLGGGSLPSSVVGKKDNLIKWLTELKPYLIKIKQEALANDMKNQNVPILEQRLAHALDAIAQEHADNTDAAIDVSSAQLTAEIRCNISMRFIAIVFFDERLRSLYCKLAMRHGRNEIDSGFTGLHHPFWQAAMLIFNNPEITLEGIVLSFC